MSTLPWLCSVYDRLTTPRIQSLVLLSRHPAPGPYVKGRGTPVTTNDRHRGTKSTLKPMGATHGPTLRPCLHKRPPTRRYRSPPHDVAVLRKIVEPSTLGVGFPYPATQCPQGPRRPDVRGRLAIHGIILSPHPNTTQLYTKPAPFQRVGIQSSPSHVVA